MAVHESTYILTTITYILTSHSFFSDLTEKIIAGKWGGMFIELAFFGDQGAFADMNVDLRPGYSWWSSESNHQRITNGCQLQVCRVSWSIRRYFWEDIRNLEVRFLFTKLFCCELNIIIDIPRTQMTSMFEGRNSNQNKAEIPIKTRGPSWVLGIDIVPSPWEGIDHQKRQRTQHPVRQKKIRMTSQPAPMFPKESLRSTSHSKTGSDKYMAFKHHLLKRVFNMFNSWREKMTLWGEHLRPEGFRVAWQTKSCWITVFLDFRWFAYFFQW